MTPVISPSGVHTTTISVPASRRSLAASISGALSAIVASRWRTVGTIFATSITPSLRFHSSSSWPTRRARFQTGNPPYPTAELFEKHAAPSLSAAKRDAQRGYNPGNRQRKTAQTHCYQHRELSPRMYVVLDHDLQAKRGVTEQSDLQQYHQDGVDRRPQPNDEGGVVAVGMPDD